MQQKVKAILDMLLGELPPGAATLQLRRTRNDDGTLFELLPSNPQAASIMVHVEDGLDIADFSFGESGTWELPYEGQNPKAGHEGILSEIDEMCRAVIAGRCEYRRGWFSSVSRIFVDGFTYQVRNILEFSLSPRTKTYAPYAISLGKE